ncbi:MAG: hypothetical protein KBD96_04935 [Brachymonas sp.]|nr:hypothetical protein [Brachymonas sp.]MBP6139511.1 hypothetical protein [Brachymonas sp.]MBP9590352.1 hypothetical protein [Brachymonas sp.]
MAERTMPNNAAFIRNTNQAAHAKWAKAKRAKAKGQRAMQASQAQKNKPKPNALIFNYALTINRINNPENSKKIVYVIREKRK